MTRKSLIYPIYYFHFSISDLNDFKDFIFMWQSSRSNQEQILWVFFLLRRLTLREELGLQN